MTRIPPVTADRAGFFGRLTYAYLRRRFGAVPEPLAVTRHHRRLFWATSVAELAAEKAHTVLPRALRDLAVYRTATTVGCSWCVDFGTMLMRHEGLDIDRLREIDRYAASPLFTPAEKLALAYADAMTAQPMTVTDEQVAALDRALGHAGVVELTHAIALENQRARFNHALGLVDQGFTSGAACRVPGSASRG